MIRIPNQSRRFIRKNGLSLFKGNSMFPIICGAFWFIPSENHTEIIQHTLRNVHIKYVHHTFGHKKTIGLFLISYWNQWRFFDGGGGGNWTRVRKWSTVGRYILSLHFKWDLWASVDRITQTLPPVYLGRWPWRKQSSTLVAKWRFVWVHNHNSGNRAAN